MVSSSKEWYKYSLSMVKITDTDTVVLVKNDGEVSVLKINSDSEGS